MSPETYNPALDVKASCREQVIHELEKFFLEWREKIVRQIYHRWIDKNPERRNYYPSREEDLVQNGGTEKDTWYSMTAYPSPDFFQRQILPTLLSLSDDPDELLQGGLDSVEIFEHLLVNDLSYGSRKTKRALVESFFQNVHTTRNGVNAIFGTGGIVATGQFKYFYGLGRADGRGRHDRFTKRQKRQLSNARKWLTSAIALHQGRQCDLHKDNGDYTEDTDHIAEMFLPAYRATPLEFRAKVMKAFVEYANSEKAEKFLKVLPECVEALKKAGGGRLLRYFFEIAELAPDKNTFSMEKSDRQFPIMEPADLARELVGLEKMKGYREHGLKLSKWLIGNDDDCGVTFVKNPHRRSGSGIIRIVSFPDKVKALESSRYSSEQICELIDAIVDTPALKRAGVYLFEHFPEIDKKFPGGFDKLLPYIRRMDNGPDSVLRLLVTCATGSLPAKNLERYLEHGIKITDQMGDIARGYFHFHDSPAMRLIEEDWTRFESLTTIEAQNTAATFTGNAESVAHRVFASSLDYSLDPNYERWKRGLFILRDGLYDLEATCVRDGRKIPPDIWSTPLYHYYESHAYKDFSSLADTEKEGKLSDNAQYEDEARILVRLAQREPYYGSKHGDYVKLRHKGVDIRIAGHLDQVEKNKWRLDPIEEVGCPIEWKKLSEAVDILNRAYDTVRGAISGTSSDKPENELVPSKIAELRLAERSLKSVSAEACVVSLFKALEIEDKIEEAIKMMCLRGLICGPMATNIGEVDIPNTSMMTTSNQHTRMAIAGISLLSAAGAIRLPGAPESPKLKLGTSDDGNFDSAQLDLLYEAAGSLRSEIAERVPIVERMILDERDRMPGIMPIGGKIHTQKPMSQEALDFLTGIFGLKNTPFKLIHAGSSLIVPPMPTALEFNMIVKILELFGVVDPQLPDIQLAVAGRWNKELAPYVGSAMLLGTDRGVLYQKGAFSTTHNNNTGARIMAYDAGVKLSGMPFDVQSAEGRTDMLGRHSLGDTFKYQILGTLASHHQFGGIFGDIMPGMERGMHRILKQYNLDRHLFDSAWVFDHAKKGDSPETHEQMVSRFTETRMSEGGIMVRDDVQSLIGRAQTQIMGQRERIITNHSGDYEKLMKY